MQYGLSDEEKSILRLSAAARILTILLALLTSLVVPPFDTSGSLALSASVAAVTRQAQTLKAGHHSAHYLWQSLALPFTQWDTVHFLAIARDGYADEQKFAFQPGVPALLAVVGRLPSWLGLSDEIFSAPIAVLTVSALASCLSIVTPIILFRLSFALSNSKCFSKKSSLLYILAPAPAILSVPYTEPFFAFFAFLGMLYLSQHQKSYLKATLCFSLAAAFRANGIMNVGFLAWHLVWRMPDVKITPIVKRILVFLVLSSVVILPFAAHQIFAYSKFCTSSLHDIRPWCDQRLPLVYSFVQAHYWNVGLMKYWTLQQLPNFVLAAPVLVASFAASWTYYSQTWPWWLQNSLPFSSLPNAHTKQATQGSNAVIHPFLNDNMLPYIHLHTLLALILLFASHVQIALRQACTNPVIFWYMAYLVEKNDKKARWWTGYCLIWGAVSIVLWTSFYPPA